MPISTDPTVAQVNGSTNGVHHNDSSKYDYDSVNLKEFPHETPASVANRTSTIEDRLEPIAVVGLALKFPQDATDPTSFWRMMMDKNSARSGIPPERFNIDAFHSAEGNKNGMMNVDGGHFICEDLANFDAPFFSLTPLEAESMDPLQRWLLEVTYHALENAGISLDRAAGSRSSVFIGSITSDYSIMAARDLQFKQAFKGTGSSASLLSNRLSWYYDLKGPSITLDTGCSSSLNAFHLACQSLRNNESDMSIVGGCNLCIDPTSFLSMAELGVLSPDGVCHSFDESANGFARGDGIGILILKPLSRALEDCDTIRAVIRATGANQSGRVPVLTQPSVDAQENMIIETYRAGGLPLDETRFVEAHGTGTPVGDPIEATTIGSTFGRASNKEPIYVGAVKSNIGHLEGASGIAGLIKTILVLENGVIPPNAWLQKINPDIDLERLNIKFPVEMTPWPTNGLRRASVNSFGLGGANAHVVLDDAFNYMKLRGLHGKHATTITVPSAESLVRHPRLASQNGHAAAFKSVRRAQLFVWSAAEEGGLERLAATYLKHLKALAKCTGEDEYLSNLAWTLSERRSHLPWRYSLVADSIDDILQRLEKPVFTRLRAVQMPQLCYAFTGQGAQWYAMGRELMEYPPFKKSLVDADVFLKDLGSSWSLIDELLRSKQDSRLALAMYSQPACTALQMALVDLLFSWNVRPTVVVGHSSGEIAAAYCVGGLNRESAWKIAYYRGMVTSVLEKEKSGAMLAAGISESHIAELLPMATGEGHLTVACINSPKSVTVSGSPSRLLALESLLERQGTFVKRLSVDVAYHSPQMEAVATRYGTLIGTISGRDFQPGRPLMFSSVSGLHVSQGDLCCSDYWVKNLVSPVQFIQALSNGCMQLSTKSREALKIDHIMELGPHGACRRYINEILAENSKIAESISYSSILAYNISAVRTALEAMGHLHAVGFPLDLNLINNPNRINHNMLVDLPPYPFSRARKYWHESRLSKGMRFRQHPHHELLGTPIEDRNGFNATWRNIIKLSDLPWIADHKANGSTIYPAAGMLVMAIEAMCQLSDTYIKPESYHFSEVTIAKAIMVPVPSTKDEIEVQIQLQKGNETSNNMLDWRDFQIYSNEHGEWSKNCWGRIAAAYPTEGGDTGSEKKVEETNLQEQYKKVSQKCMTYCHQERLYSLLFNCGYEFGPTFRSLRNVWHSSTGDAIAMTNVGDWIARNHMPPIRSHLIHPAALDAVFQVALPALSVGGTTAIPTVVPTRIRTLSIYADNLASQSSVPDKVKDDFDTKVCGTSRKSGYRHVETSLVALGTKNNLPIVNGTIQGTVVSQGSTNISMENGTKRFCYHIDWKPDIELLSPRDLSKYCSFQNRTPDTYVHDMLRKKMILCYVALQALDTTSQIELSPNAPQHLKQYIKWYERVRQTLQPNDPDYNLGMIQDLVSNKEKLRQFSKTIEDYDAEGRLIVRVVQSFEGIIQGKVDTLELMFSDGLMDEFYAAHRNDGDIYAAYHGALRYVDALAHKRTNLKFLEIGAGTGGTTQGMLETLMQDGFVRCWEYVFTDISPEFFEKARRRFKEYESFVDYAMLDIEKDPTQQGFMEGGYDIVVAANALHATRSLQSTLQNTRKLLKPGGKLILLELTPTNRVYPGCIFGLLPGWWRSEEDFRAWEPLATIDRWNALLRSSGFSGTETVLPERVEPGQYNVIITTAVEHAGKHTVYDSIPESKQDVAIIVNSALELQIADRLKSKQDPSRLIQYEYLTLSEVNAATLGQRACIFLADLEHSVLRSMSADNLQKLQCIVSSARSILWVTQAKDTEDGPMHSLVAGFIRCLQDENREKVIVALKLEEIQDLDRAVDTIAKAMIKTSLVQPNEQETEYLEIEGRLCISRTINSKVVDSFMAQKTGKQVATVGKLRQTPSRDLQLTMGSAGLLDTFYFMDAATNGSLGPEDLEVKVMAAGLNFKDVLVALGQATNNWLGMECSGIVTKTGQSTGFQIGDRVACFVPRAIATTVRCEAFATVKLPDDMTFRDGAACIITLLTAYYAIVDRARIRNGESILIHSAAGGFGQACIQIARLYGAEIFATVGSETKKDFLVQRYGIRQDHIFSSRSSAFAAQIKSMKNNQGIDIIVNSLSGPALRLSWDCIAPFGRFLDVTKTDMLLAKEVSMLPFSRDACYIGINLDLLRTFKNSTRKLLRAVWDLVLDKKVGVPSPVHEYSISHVERAFRYLESGKSLGKIVINMEDDNDVRIAPTQLPTYTFEKNATYLIVGGLGGLGRSTALWMAGRNAKNIILLGRSSTHKDEVISSVEDLRQKGVNVAVVSCDVSDKTSLIKALADCSHMPPIKGVIHGAMVLADKTFMNMTAETFRSTQPAKIDGSWNLHQVLPTGLDFFIMLSSLGGALGLAGQSNYATANAYQDALAAYRVSRGEKAVSLDLCLVGSVGHTASPEFPLETVVNRGFGTLQEAEYHALLDYYCDPSLPCLSGPESQLLVGLQDPAALEAQRIPIPDWLTRPRFRTLHNNGNIRFTVDRPEEETNYTKLMQKAGTLSEAADVALDGIRTKLSRTLAVEIKNVDPDRPASNYGIDSLSAIELRVWFKAVFGAEIPVIDILNKDTIRVLAKLIVQKSSYTASLRESSV